MQGNDPASAGAASGPAGGAPVALVTGGAKGIGAAAVRRFLRAGHRVAALDRDAAALLTFTRELEAGADVLPIVGDVTRRADADDAVARVESTWGRLDVLVNNAGANRAMAFAEHTDADWDGLLQLNLTSAFYFIRAALPALRRSRGSVVNVSSMTALVGQPRGAAYVAAKAGLNGLTRALALELGPEGVRVNAVCPAGVDTPLMRAWAAEQPDPEAVVQAQARMHVLGRLATPDEIAEAIWFLGSAQGSFVTGTILEIEGGATLGYRRA